MSCKFACVLHEPILAPSFGNGFEDCRLGHCGNVDPKFPCALERLDIKRVSEDQSRDVWITRTIATASSLPISVMAYHRLHNVVQTNGV